MNISARYLKEVCPEPEESKKAYRIRTGREPYKNFNRLIFNAYCGNVDNIHLRNLLLYANEKIGYGAILHILKRGYDENDYFYKKILEEIIDFNDIYNGFKKMESVPIYGCKNIFHYINSVKSLNNDKDRKKDLELNSGINKKNLRERLLYSDRINVEKYKKALEELTTGKARVKNEYTTDIFNKLAEILSESYKPIVVGNKEKKLSVNLTLF